MSRSPFLRLVLSGIALMLALSPAWAQSSSGAKALKIARIEGDQTSLVASLILKAIYDDIGIIVTFEDFSPRRALRESGRGAADGETMRIAGLTERFPDLRAVPVPLITVEGRLYTISFDKTFSSLSELGDTEIGIVGGILVDEEATKENRQRLTTDVSTLFRQLARGRLDLALTDQFSAEIEIRKNFPDSGISTTGPLIYSVDLFHYVHHRHEGLIPALAEALQRSRETGRFTTLMNEAFRSVARLPSEPID